MRLVALALELPPDFFTKHMEKSLATLRLLHYSTLPEGLQLGENVISAGAHTDYGLITILRQDQVGGLQVLNYKEKYWVHAIPIPNAYVINFADMLATWSGHKVKSTIHRVVHLSRKERYSVPFFVAPNANCIVEPGGNLSCIEVLKDRYRAAGILKEKAEKPT
jgi:isopenicillin N synthase-like dioxygenase